MENEEMLRVVKVEPGKPATEAQLNNDFHSLQDAVSIGAPERGHIESLGLGDGTVILCNEEGKLIGLTPNRRFHGDILVGVFYIVGTQGDEFRSLTDEERDKYINLFKEPEEISIEEMMKTFFGLI